VPALFNAWLLFSQLCLLIAGTILGELYLTLRGHNGQLDVLPINQQVSFENTFELTTGEFEATPAAGSILSILPVT
jgi:hypothetical protein